MPHRPGCLLLLWPPMRSFSSFMSQKEAWLKMKGYTSQSPSPRSERGEDPPLQGPCCYSKHLPLCGRSSSPIVVQKLVVLPLAPFGSRGMRQTPLLFRVQIHGWIDAWPRLPSPLAVALCPLSNSTLSRCVFPPSSSQCCSLLKNTCEPTFL